MAWKRSSVRDRSGPLDKNPIVSRPKREAMGLFVLCQLSAEEGHLTLLDSEDTAPVGAKISESSDSISQNPFDCGRELGMSSSILKSKIKIESGVRVPKLRERKDGRWCVQWKVGKASRTKYFGRGDTKSEKDRIKRDYAFWTNDYVNQRLLGSIDPAPQQKLMQHGERQLELGEALSEHAQEVIATSNSRMAKRRTRGGYGLKTKDVFAHEKLQAVLTPFLRRRTCDLGHEFPQEVLRSFQQVALAWTVTVSSGDTAISIWSWQTGNDVTRQLRRFIRWCGSLGKIKSATVDQFCDPQYRKDLVRRLTPNRSREKNDHIDRTRFLALQKSLGEDPLLSLLVSVQCETLSRPSEVLRLSATQITNTTDDSVAFKVEHKTDYLPEVRLREIIVYGEVAAKVKLLFEISGDAPIFSDRMRATIFQGWGDVDELRKRYFAESRRSERAMTADRYRKLLQQHDVQTTPYSIRRYSITRVATEFGMPKAAFLAGHADQRMTSRYISYSINENDSIRRAASVVLKVSLPKEIE